MLKQVENFKIKNMNKYIIILALFTVSCAKKVEPTYGLQGSYIQDYEIVDGVTKDVNSIYSLIIDETNFTLYSDTGSSLIYPYFATNDSIYFVVSGNTVVHYYKASKEYLELTKYYDTELRTVFCKRVE